MKTQFLLALTVFGLSVFLVQTLSAAQVLAVASNGKCAMVCKLEYDADFKAISAEAISECKAKGGTDPKIVWSEKSNFLPTKGAGNNCFARSTIAHGAIAISDHGAGNILGWSVKHYRNGKRAIEDCRRKGGQNPKIVARF
jgi:hypothetical protein